MFRKFKFEEEIYEKLQTIPLSTQFKLDRIGAKITLKNWNRFLDEEKQVLCHLSVRSQGELGCYRDYLMYLLRKIKEKVDLQDHRVNLIEKDQWETLGRIPEGVYLRALRLKVIISPGDWIRLDDLERYALVRLSVENQPIEIFAKALQEFMGISIPQTIQPSRAS